MSAGHDWSFPEYTEAWPRPIRNLAVLESKLIYAGRKLFGSNTLREIPNE